MTRRVGAGSVLKSGSDRFFVIKEQATFVKFTAFY
jgi:hypothetical protein